MPETALTRALRQPIDIETYLVGSTVLSVFLWQVLFTGSLDFRLGYVIVLVNCVVLLARGSLVVHRNHAYFLAGLTFVSVLAAAVTNNPIRATAAQVLGISVFSIYHYSILIGRRISLTRLMEIYAWFSAAVAVIGFPMWIIALNGPSHEYRFHSWFVEPSHYVYATLPAVSFLMLRWQREGVRSLAAVTLLVTYLLADSLTGYLGIGITVLLMTNFRSIVRVLLICVFVATTAFAAYSLSANVRVRVDGALNAELTSEISGEASSYAPGNHPLDSENQTTLAWLSNSYVAFRAFIQSPIFGNGLGTHSYSYDRYAGEVLSPENPSWGITRTDANSLGLRLLSETGILGVVVVLFLLIYFSRVRGDSATLIRDAMLPYFAMRLLRFGAYFSMELYFFALIYAFNYLDFRSYARDNERGILDA